MFVLTMTVVPTALVGAAHAQSEFDGWRVMPVREQMETQAGQIGGRAEQFMQGAARCEANSQVIYLSHDCSQNWRSVDNGMTWDKPLSKGLWMHHGQSIEVDPVNCDVVLQVVDNNKHARHEAWRGLYRSVDGGNHWEFVLPGPASHSRRFEHNIAWARSSITARGARRWYVALYDKNAVDDANARLYISDDYGATWNPGASLRGIEGVFEVRVSPHDQDHVTVATSSGLWQSRDGGISLDNDISGLTSGQAVTSVGFTTMDGETLLAVSGGRLYRSSDGGHHAEPLQATPTHAALSDALRVSTHPRRPNTYYVIPVTEETAAISQNGGVDWDDVAVTDPPRSIGWGLQLRGDFAFILFNPNDPVDAIGQIKGAAIYRSRDGREFTPSSTLLTGAYCAGMAFDPNDSNHIAFSMIDIGMHVTYNRGEWFERYAVPYSWIRPDEWVAHGSMFAVAIKPDAPQTLLTSVGRSADRVVIRSTHGGEDWQRIGERYTELTARNIPATSFHPTAPNVAFIANLRSVNSGEDFTPMAGLPAEANYVGYCQARPDTLYAVDEHDTVSGTTTIYRSTDRGDSWDPWLEPDWDLAPWDKKPTVGLDPHDCDTIYVVNAENNLARYDSGSWTHIDVLRHVARPSSYYSAVRTIRVDPNQSNIVYVAILGAGHSTHFRSMDRGRTWDDITYNKYRANGGPLFINPHSGEVFVSGCSGTWVLPAPYAASNRMYPTLPGRPSCFDGLQNGTEADIDCGGTCRRACNVPPADAGVPPADSGTPPADSGVPPADSAAPPADAGVPPADSGVFPADAGVGSTDSATPSDAGLRTDGGDRSDDGSAASHDASGQDSEPSPPGALSGGSCSIASAAPSTGGGGAAWLCALVLLGLVRRGASLKR